MDWIKAALYYFATVFAVGFALGPLREFLVKPWAGGIGALLVEAPIMLVAMIYLAPRAMSWANLGKGLARRAAMGLTAFALVVLAEGLAAHVLRGWSMSEWIGHFASPQGRLGLALYVVFAAVPLVSRTAAVGDTR